MKFSGKSFNLKIKIEAPVGGRAGTVTNLLKKFLNKTECFTVKSTNLDSKRFGEDYILDIIFHEGAVFNILTDGK